MKIITKDITIKNEKLTLTNQRALYWQRKHALIVSDLHIGKTAHFRRHGIPMPDDILQKDLERLKILIYHFEAKHIWIVGDLFHAESNTDMQTFKVWLQQFKDLKWMLIKGNHDRLPIYLMTDFDIEVTSQLHVAPFYFEHQPSNQSSKKFTISGHIHPGILIKGKGRQRLKLPCYQVANSKLILPAFSLFTGLNTNNQFEDVISYAFTNTEIFEF